MADAKISALTAVTGNGAATDQFAVAASGVSKMTTLQKIANFAKTYIQQASTDLVSAATVDLSTATGNSVTVTGTGGPITSLGTVQAGALFILTTPSALTFTHNATSLICPNARDLVTRANSQVFVQSLGSGNWRIAFSTPVQPASDLISLVSASAATSVNFTAINNTLYNSYILIGDNIVPGTNAVQLLLRFSVAGVFDAGALSYEHHAWRWTSAASGVGGSTGDTAIQIVSSETLGTAVNQFASFNANIFNPTNGNRKQVTWSATGLFASGSYVSLQGGGRFLNSISNIDGIQVIASAGTISGTFALYGMRNT